MPESLKSLFLDICISFSCFLALSAAAETRINNSLIAFTVAEKDLLPESIAYDPETSSFYLSSTRKGKILRRDADGSTSDFATVEDGLWMTLGIKVDASRRHLWVCSSGGSNLLGFRREQGNPAGIFKFDLDSGELLWKHVVDLADETHFFNDLVIAENGDVFATHMLAQPSIYKISGGQVTPHFSSYENLRYPNGLTLSEDEKFLFVAHSDGIGRVDRDTGDWVNLTSEHRINDNDGLYFHKGSLIGVRQDARSVARYSLDQSMASVTAVETLELNHPMMNMPTTGVIVDDHLYYIANAQFESFNEDGSLVALNQLYELVVLKLPL